MLQESQTADSQSRINPFDMQFPIQSLDYLQWTNPPDYVVYSIYG